MKLIPLAREALAAGIEVGYTRRLIRTLGLVPDPPPLEIETWPWELKLYTLGRFEVKQNDAPLSFSRKAPKKPLQLLKTLIALGGKNVSDSRLIDALWPQEQGDAAYNAFTTTLHRLRQLLGPEPAASASVDNCSAPASKTPRCAPPHRLSLPRGARLRQVPDRRAIARGT